MNPHFASAYFTLGLIQEQRTEFDESVAAFQRAIQLSPQSPIMRAALGRALALVGKRDEALGIVADLHKLSEKRYVSPFDLAACSFALDLPDEGFELLTKAFQDRCFELICLRVDPSWQFLEKDSRFQTLLSNLGLP